jgi:coproporphyrinogen III oxidase-like Fe-S oxidoreductase
MDGFTASRRVLDPGEITGEFMLNALRLNDGFTLDQFTARTGIDSRNLESELESLCQRGLLEQDRNGVRATGVGRRFLDSVIAEFFPG